MCTWRVSVCGVCACPRPRCGRCRAPGEGGSPPAPVSLPHPYVLSPYLLLCLALPQGEGWVSHSPACVPPTSGVPVPSPLRWALIQEWTQQTWADPKLSGSPASRPLGRRRWTAPAPTPREAGGLTLREHCMAKGGGPQCVLPPWARSLPIPLPHGLFVGPHWPRAAPSPSQACQSKPVTPPQFSLSVCKLSDSFTYLTCPGPLAGVGEAWGSKAESHRAL